MPAFAAFATRGLEDVAAAEAAAADPAGPRVVAIRPKLVLVEAAGPIAFRQLRTVDDAAAVAAQSPSVADLPALRALVADGDLEGAIGIANRADRVDGTFSVTISAARTALGPASVIEEAVAHAVSARYGWRPVRLQRAPIDVRVFIDSTWALLGVRLFDEPLSRRSYRVASAHGALRPTVAAALVRLATPDGGRQRVWDPFCGSGTILCEAASLGHDVWGTDINSDAAGAAQQNLLSVNRRYQRRVEIADSTSPKTWQQHGSATTVISNLPWGKQVAIASKQALYDRVCAGVADLARHGGTSVLLTTEPNPVVARLRRAGLRIDQRRIGLLGQTPTIVSAQPGDEGRPASRANGGKAAGTAGPDGSRPGRTG